MSDPTISPEEIDALMQAVQSGPADPLSDARTKGERRAGKGIKSYDFANPDKFSKEQLRALEMLYANCARATATQLASLLRTPVEVECRSIAEASYRDFFDAMSEHTSVALVRIEPLVGRAMLEFDPGISLAMVDRLLGGPGRKLEVERELTEIEKGLMERVLERVMKSFVEAWSAVVPLKPELEMIVGSSLISQISMSEDRMILADFPIRFGTVSGRLQFGIPTTTLDPVLSKLNAQQWFASTAPARSVSDEEAIRQSLDRMNVELKVELGRAEVSMKDLLELQVGDLICLDRRAGSDMDLRVGTELKFRGQPGRVGRHLGFQVTQVVKEEG
jgi:flagellar motor switch protein FliM